MPQGTAFRKRRIMAAATARASPLLGVGVLSLSMMLASAQQPPQPFGVSAEDNGGGQQPACYAGWSESCQDDPTFRSPLSLPCSGHQSFDCRMTDIIGFTEDEIYELVNACPCSCRIKCGTHTKEPTLAPSPFPTVSHQPSSKPSAAPSAQPTARPTTSPTASPTLSPTFAPTKSPTLHPTLTPTKNPTESPSHFPSSIPTMTPTEGPTLMHSSSPSAGPSSRPSEKPSQEPSRAPTEFPTESPTRSPTSSPTPPPTLRPTLTPSSTPSTPPTLSQQPSAEPTISHSPTISGKPSSAPSKTPSSQPTSEPSRLTMSPSAGPSVYVPPAEKWAALAKSSIGSLNKRGDDEESVPFLTTLHIIIITSVGGAMVLLTVLYCIISRSQRRRRDANLANDEEREPKVLFMRSRSFADRFNSSHGKEEVYEDDEEHHRKSKSPYHYNYRDTRRGLENINSQYSMVDYPRNSGIPCVGGLNALFCAAQPPPTPGGDSSVQFRVAM